jgi:RHS repeat-associated protein
MDLGEAVLDLTSGGVSFRHADFRGNVMFASTNSGTIAGSASYRGFGRLSATGSLGERGFAGGFEIPSLGLVVLGPRVLDSDAGRFLSQDPVFNAVNLYAYAQGNPVYMWDPTGHVGVSLSWGEAGGTQFNISATLTFPVSVTYNPIANTVTFTGAISGPYATLRASATVPGNRLLVMAAPWAFNSWGIKGQSIHDVDGSSKGSSSNGGSGGGGGRGSAGRGGPGSQPGDLTVTPAADLSVAFAGSGIATGGGYYTCASPLRPVPSPLPSLLECAAFLTAIYAAARALVAAQKTRASRAKQENS